MKNVIVVGGGAAGMMAAYSAALCGHHVILLEQNEKLGKKVYITGKGRCNVTNAGDTNEFFDSVVSNPKFLYSSIYGFDAFSVMDFFETHGCKLKTERGNRVFPVSDHSSDVIRTLEQTLLNHNVEIKKNHKVLDLLVSKEGEKSKAEGVEVLDDRNRRHTMNGDAVILAVGGKSYPVTGSDGKFHSILEKYGHNIIPMRPGLVPLEIKGDYCQRLQGLSLKNVKLSLIYKGECIYEGFGEMLFTHFGMSGPLVLTAASYKNHKGIDEGCLVKIDLKPSLSEEQLDKRILRDFDKAKNKQFKNSLNELLPSKMIPLIPMLTDIPEDKPVNEITKEERGRLKKVLKSMEFEVIGTRDFNEAIITIGGVDIRQINPSTMESKLIKNLFLAGEMLDVDALTGGYNLQIAWSTGYLAGCSVE